MKRGIKKIVRQLPGFTSYCECVKLCSNMEVEHVVPKSFLKKVLINGKFNQANNDMHNLFRCCSRINSQKGAGLLGVDWDAGSHNSYLARSALYMDWKYGLEIPDYLLMEWKLMALEIEPLEFEYERNNIISSHQGNDNVFITEFPGSIIYY